MKTKFFTQHQNNSGGIFDHDPKVGIGYAVCVEAIDTDHADSRLGKIVGSYYASGDCPCCGERWSISFWDEDGADEPSNYSRPLRGGWGIPSYIHYLNGRIEERPDPDAKV